MIILKLYALVSDCKTKTKLYEIDASQLRVGYALANDKPATVHWEHADAEELKQNLIKGSGSTSLTIERVQIDALSKLIQLDIDSGEATEETNVYLLA